jgi:hypothetical protein
MKHEKKNKLRKIPTMSTFLTAEVNKKIKKKSGTDSIVPSEYEQHVNYSL